MKTNNWQKVMAVLMVAFWAASGTTTQAQNSVASGSSSATTASTSAPQLSTGAAQILQLAQAKVGDDTIMAFIRNSGNSYGLNADQIIYLRQQGISDAVLGAMLSQSRAGVTLSLPSTPAPQPVAATASAVQVPTATVATAPTYVQTVPQTTYYYPSTYYYPATYDYYYPAYAWYPPVTVGWGWGWGWGGGWYHGGWHGGGYGGGHGGGYGGGHGGGGHGGGHR